MSSTGSSQTLKRQASSETIRVSKHTRYSTDGIWKAAGVFSNGVSRSSSHIAFPPCPTRDRSNETPSHQNRSDTSVGAGAGHKHNLSVSYGVEINHQVSGQPARVEHGHQAIACLSRIIGQGIPAHVDQGDMSPGTWEESSKENRKETQQQPFPQSSKGSSKGKEREEATDSPRPALRVINTHPRPDESLLPAPPPFSVPYQPVTVRVANEVVPVVSPSEIVGDASTWSIPIFAADYLANAPMQLEGPPYTQTAVLEAITQYVQYLTRTGQARICLRINPRETHTTFWDAEHGEQLTLKGRLELFDLLHETCYHHAEIVVRSYVEHNVRGLEHLDEPEFTVRYKEPPRHYDSDPYGGINAAATEAAGVAARAQPPIYFMRDGMADDLYGNAEAEIRTAEWVKLEKLLFPMWAKYYTVPIPARLFETRESRIFRLEATVSFHSKLENGRQYTLRAPPVEVSVSHLVSSRELGIPWPRPSRHPFDQAH